MPVEIPEFEFAVSFAPLDAINPAIAAIGRKLNDPEGVDAMI
jgi:hypothetical protein